MNTTHSAKISAIIPAAGQGQRMRGQGNKLFLELAGTPVLLFTLKTFQECTYIDEIVIPAALNDIPIIEKLVKDNGVTKVTAIIEGGKERQDSVFKALQAINPAMQKVVVHDGARPLLPLSDLVYFLEHTHNLDAAVMAVLPKDTIKKVDESDWVVETPPRRQLRLIQTPQLFQRELLEKVHIQALEQGYYATDDASLMEWQGYGVKVMEGSYENIKVTTPEDLLLAEAILKRRGEV